MTVLEPDIRMLRCNVVEGHARRLPLAVVRQRSVVRRVLGDDRLKAQKVVGSGWRPTGEFRKRCCWVSITDVPSIQETLTVLLGPLGRSSLMFGLCSVERVRQLTHSQAYQ
jgi:hypothetical protein